MPTVNHSVLDVLGVSACFSRGQLSVTESVLQAVLTSYRIRDLFSADSLLKGKKRTPELSSMLTTGERECK